MKNHIFVGKKIKPSYLLEFNKDFSKVTIYQPDKLSMKEKDYFEKYSLGILIGEYLCDEIIIIKDNLTKFKENYLYIQEIIIKHKNKYILINNSITQLSSYKKL
jgi:hypothetical protein